MGMFDSVMVECPKCEAQVEFQSKAGNCYLSTYYVPGDVPADIAADLLGGVALCECGESIELTSASPHPPPLTMYLGIK